MGPSHAHLIFLYLFLLFLFTHSPGQPLLRPTLTFLLIGHRLLRVPGRGGASTLTFVYTVDQRGILACYFSPTRTLISVLYLPSFFGVYLLVVLYGIM